MLRTFSLLTSMLLFAAGATSLAAQRPLSAAGRSVVYAPQGMVATSQPLASSAGLAVLQAGGNAIDAAVTAAAVLSVTEPMMTGMVGDMFATVWVAKEHRLVAINASGRAGALMTREALLARGRKTMPERGIETVTVEESPAHPDRRQLLHVDQPSADRVAPISPFFGSCGGCALQQTLQRFSLQDCRYLHGISFRPTCFGARSRTPGRVPASAS